MESTSETATYTAPDISCGHCEMTVKNAIGAFDGVERVDASSETKEVSVTYDPALVSPAQIEAALAGAGYPVKPR